MKLINSTPNGQIFYCPCHDTMNLEFGNMLFKMSKKALEQFAKHINSIDYELYLKKNRKAQNKRKLLLKIGTGDAYLTLNLPEFLELRDLVSFRSNAGVIDTLRLIDFTKLLN